MGKQQVISVTFCERLYKQVINYVEFRRENARLFMPDGKLKRNLVFKSSSAAAKFVCGFSVAGPVFGRMRMV